jgi:hypothetical protein
MKYEDKAPVVITSKTSIDDGREHSIRIQKFPDNAKIQVTNVMGRGQRACKDNFTNCRNFIPV